MSTNEPNASPSSNNVGNTGKNIFEKLTLGGKLMCGGGIVAIVAAFLNAYSVRISTKSDNPLFKVTGFDSSATLMVIKDWRGVVAVIACAGCAVLALLLTKTVSPSQSKKITLSSLVASGVAVLMAILVFVRYNSRMDLGGSEASWSAGPGLGTYLILIASLVCLTGSVLHARDKNLF